MQRIGGNELAKKIAALAIFVCAFMLITVAAPLATADTHHVVKGTQGPRASAVTWEYLPETYGIWTGHIVNSGLRWLVIDVDDVTSGTPISIMHQRIRFAAYPTDTLDTRPCIVAKDRVYLITATPNGPKDSWCDIEDAFVPHPPIPALFTYTVVGPTVYVDGSATQDPDGTIVAWGWEWGDGTTGTGMTASHTYASPGTYTVIMTVVDNDGITGSAGEEVTITDNPPVAAFAMMIDFPSTYPVVYVDGSASTDDWSIASYSWDWGDGLPLGEGVVANHAYPLGTDHVSVTLTVTDSAGQTDSIMHEVFIPNMPPVAAFTYVVSMLTVSVDASPSTDEQGIIDYAWNWGDGATGSGVRAAHTYATAGTYQITLTVMDLREATTSVTKDVDVNVPPIEISFTGVTASGGLLTVEAVTSGPAVLSYDWNFGDHIIASGVTHTHRYYSTGTYDVTLTVTLSGGIKYSITKQFTVVNNQIPDIPFSMFGYTFASDGTTLLGGCAMGLTNVRTGETLIDFLSDLSEPQTGFYFVNSIGILYFVTGDIAVISAVGPQGQQGSSSVVLDFSGTPFLEVNVTVVDDPPIAAFTGTVEGLTVTVDATASTDDQGIVSYVWNWGDGSPNTFGVTAAHTYSELMLVVITLTVTDTIGQTSSIQLFNPLGAPWGDQPPVARFTSTASVTPDFVTLAVDASASTDDHGIVSYTWNWGDGSPSGSGVTATHGYPSGTVSVAITLMVMDTIGQTNSVTHSISVPPHSPPTADFTGVAYAANGTLVVDASSSTSAYGIVKYDWDFGDSIVASGIARTHIYWAPGAYTVTLTVMDLFGQTASISQTFAVAPGRVPPMAPIAYGRTLAEDGVTQLPSCTLRILNEDTGETLVGVTSNETGFYWASLLEVFIRNYFSESPLHMIISAVGPDGQVGSAAATLDPLVISYVEVNITLSHNPVPIL